MDSARPVYSIGAVSRMLDVPTSTIRSWEERYGVVQPARSPGGHRVYTRDQVEQLRFVSDNIADGIQPGDAHRLLQSRIEGSERLTQHISETNILVLLAERDPYAADLADYFLRTEGYDTIVVTSASEAEAVLRDSQPHMAIIDLLVSGNDPLELCRELATTGKTGVVAISPIESRDVALGAGAHAFLQKPVDPILLVSTVRDVLGRSAYLGTPR